MSADEVEVGIGRAKHLARRPGGPTDLGRVATDREARRIELRDAVGDVRLDAVGRGAGHRGEGVPLVGVAGRDPQHPRSMGRDQDRDPRPLDRGRSESGVVEPVVLRR